MLLLEALSIPCHRIIDVVFRSCGKILALYCYLQSVLSLCDVVFAFGSVVGFFFDCVEGVVHLLNIVETSVHSTCHFYNFQYKSC